MYKGMNQAAAQHLLSSMYPPPYDGMGLYEQAKPSLMYRVPRVVPDQKGRFETDELFRRLSRESEVRRRSTVSLSRRLNHAAGTRPLAVRPRPRALIAFYALLRYPCAAFAPSNETSNENRRRRSRF